jgi:O-acetyl-ADP-ribose deacetylase (regulator of RNase III)
MDNVRFILCDPKKNLADAWLAKIKEHLAPEDASRFSVIHGYLDEVTSKFDCIVSPGNCNGIMDGTADLVISRMFCEESVPAVIDTVQRHLHRTWNGFQPPGTCEIIDMRSFNEERFSCKFIAHCPTMRIPSAVRWDKEIVYRCFWSLLNALKRHNETRPEKDQTRKVLCFGLATGVGQIPVEVCAGQMILAWKKFHERESQDFRMIDWKAAYRDALDVEETHRVAAMHL